MTSPSEAPPEYADSVKSTNSKDSSKVSDIKPGSIRRRGTAGSARSSLSLKTGSDDERTPRPREADWGIGDDARSFME
jgi:hypothetical protein